MRVGAVHKSSSRRRWLRQILIFGVGAGVVLTLGLGVWTMIPQPHSAPGQHHEFAAVASIAGGENPITIIVTMPNSDDCHRYQLNAATGVRSDNGTDKCVSEGGRQITRVEAISQAFRNR